MRSSSGSTASLELFQSYATVFGRKSLQLLFAAISNSEEVDLGRARDLVLAASACQQEFGGLEIAQAEAAHHERCNEKEDPGKPSDEVMLACCVFTCFLL